MHKKALQKQHLNKYKKSSLSFWIKSFSAAFVGSFFLVLVRKFPPDYRVTCGKPWDRFEPKNVSQNLQVCHGCCCFSSYTDMIHLGACPQCFVFFVSFSMTTSNSLFLQKFLRCVSKSFRIRRKPVSLLTNVKCCKILLFAVLSLMNTSLFTNCLTKENSIKSLVLYHFFIISYTKKHLE